MKTKIWLTLSVALGMIIFFSSCELFEDDNKDIGGDPSPMGEVGNTFDVSTMDGVSDVSIKVTERNGDVSKVTFSGNITDPTLKSLVSALPDVNMVGNTLSVTREYKITTNGVMSVYPEGNLTLMDYGAKVGDSWSLTHAGKNLKRTVTSKSSTDDYNYGFMLIKVVKVEETGRGIPGVNKIEFVGNHRFGMVGIKLYFEDGSDKLIVGYSDAENK